MQADSGFSNMVIILTYTILKSQALEGEKVLCSVRLARDPHPSSCGSYDSWSVVSTCSPAPTFHSCPRETGEEEEHGDYFLGLHAEVAHVTSSHIHGPTLGHTWK